MIRYLSIQHLAVVETLELELDAGLTVLTGETGTGKSVILSALGLLVGGRATGDMVRTGQDKAVVQATVETGDGREVILRREVTTQGRSRAFIDDTLATAAALQKVGRRLVDLHGQHDHQALLDARNHLGLLDRFDGLADDTRPVQTRFRDWRSAAAALEQLRRAVSEHADRTELLTFQRDEIDRIAPTAGEDDALLATRLRLANAERLAELCQASYQALYERDDAVLPALGAVWRQVEELATLDPAVAAQLESRPSIDSQLEELAFFLRSYAASIEDTPGDLAEVEARLASLERLKKKYGPTLSDVLAHRARLDDELAQLADTDTRMSSLTAAEDAARHRFLDAARTLGRKRRAAASRLQSRLVDVLGELAIPGARFEVRFLDEALAPTQWTEDGIDSAEFFFSANPGESLRPLAKVASGGELSRLMLGLKTLASTDEPGKTLIFDEVDAGIGGAVADRVGRMLYQLGAAYQVLTVTHLPQIAAYGSHHHRVSKVVREDRTITQIDRLAEQGRVAEIARLMTGGASAAALVGAQDLLTSKQKTKGESERAKAKRG